MRLAKFACTIHVFKFAIMMLVVLIVADRKYNITVPIPFTSYLLITVAIGKSNHLIPSGRPLLIGDGFRRAEDIIVKARPSSISTPVECDTPLDELERIVDIQTDGSQKENVDKFRVDSAFIAS